MFRLLFIFSFCFLCSWTSASDFKFAFITDVHINSSATAADDLRASVDQINKAGGIEFVIVAGDITEEGDRESLVEAKTILDCLNVKYYIIPGNHDTKWTESGATYFNRLFGSDRFKFKHSGYFFCGFNSGPLLRMADGHVSPQDISWLRKELKKVGKEQPVIIITHYPLREGDVDNWYDVTDAIRPYNIRAVLGGHYHQNKELRYDGIPGILNRSNLRAEDSVGGYTLYEVTQDSIIVYEQKIGGQKRKWASLSTHEKYYEADKTVDKRPDFSVNERYKQVSACWEKRIGVGIYTSPLVCGNDLFVGDDLGFLSCFDVNTGKKRWSFKTGNRIAGTPAVEDGIIVFGSSDKNIYGLDVKTGRKRWIVKASEPVLGAVSIRNGIAYIGGSDHMFRAIDIKNGKLRWTYGGVTGYVETRPLVTSESVIFGAWDNTLYALNKDSGELLWKWTGNLTRMHYSPAAVWPVSVDNKVFIVDPQRAMTSIDIKTGETIWRTRQSSVRETIGLSEDKERVYAKTMNDSIVCFSSRGNKPVKMWASNVGYGYDFAPSMMEEKDNIVFGSNKNGLIFALEAKTGNVVWIHKVGNSLVNTVLTLSDRRVVYTTTSGEMGVLQWK